MPTLMDMKDFEELLDRISEEFFRRERTEEAKKLFYLEQARNKTPKGRSPDKWYHTPKSPQHHTGAWYQSS